MTFAPTYEELLARNEKYENAIRDAITVLDCVMAMLQDKPDQPYYIMYAADDIYQSVENVQSNLERALQ